MQLKNGLKPNLLYVVGIKKYHCVACYCTCHSHTKKAETFQWLDMTKRPFIILADPIDAHSFTFAALAY